MMATLSLTVSEYQRQAIKARAHAARKRPRDFIIDVLGISQEPELNWPDDYVPENDIAATYSSYEEFSAALNTIWQEAQDER